MHWNDRIGRRLKLRDLHILLAVVQARGIAKAGRRLAVSQPAVSRAIADMEAALGVRLLDRSAHGIEPTPFGLALIKRGIAVFDELRQGIRDIEFLSDPTAGNLRIGTTGPIAAAIVSPVIERLTRQNPRMAFHVVADDTIQLFQELTERNIELAITRMTGATIEAHLTAEILFDDSLVVATGTNNPWLRRRNVKLTDLVNEPWTLHPYDSYYGALIADAFRASGLEPPRLTVSTSSLGLRSELLATGRFFTVVPSFSLRLPRRHSTLKAMPVELPNTRRPIGIVTVRNRSPSPLAQLFLDRVREIIKPPAKSGQG
jgi:DNA-binding transcriptional LysR family regulator